MEAMKKGKRKSQAGPRGGIAYPIGPAWKAEIRRLLAESGLNQAELARRIKCSPAAVVLVLGPDSRASTLVAAIHRVFGLVAPAHTTTIQRITPPTTTATA
jgi:hypothetical protein